MNGIKAVTVGISKYKRFEMSKFCNYNILRQGTKREEKKDDKNRKIRIKEKMKKNCELSISRFKKRRMNESDEGGGWEKVEGK